MKKIRLDLTGQKFNRWLVLSFAEIRNNHSYWNCLCDCGKQLTILGSSLKSNHTKSCGCHKSEVTSIRNTKHSNSIRGEKTSEYKTWSNIKNRVLDSNNPKFKYYGGRGITISKEWLKFENFLQDMGVKSTSKHTIDRIDNSLGYFKENCRWALMAEQNLNKRSNKILEYNNKKQSLKNWCNELNLNYKAVQQRLLKLKWTVKDAFETPIKLKKK